jgi:hypothetical protein
MEDIEGNIITLAEAVTSFSELPMDLETSVKLPYIREHVRLITPGVWNGLRYTDGLIAEAYNNTDWTDPKNRALYVDHPERQRPGTSDPRMWIGEVRNIDLVGNELYGDLIVVDKPMAMKLAFGAKFGLSPSLFGAKPDGSGNIGWATYKNFALVLDPAIEGNYVNSGVVNVYYNSVEDDKMTDKEVQKVQLAPEDEDLKEIYEAFATDYKAVHPDAKDFEIKTALLKALSPPADDAEDDKDKEKDEGEEDASKKVDLEPKDKKEETKTMEPSKIDNVEKDIKEKFDALTKRYNVIEKRLGEVDKAMNVPDMKSAPTGNTSVPDRSPDQMMMDYLKRMNDIK